MSEEKTYEQQYEEAASELEAAAQGIKPEAITEKPEPEQPLEEADEPEDTKPADPAPDDETPEKLKADLVKMQKALQDTQRWGHENAQRLRELERSGRKKPGLLDEVPELEDVVRHVVQDQSERARMERQQEHEKALSLVMKVMPDVPQLLQNPEFYKAMEARREAIGADAFDLDPAVILREITAEKSALAERKHAAAIEAAKKDAQRIAKAKVGMAMPGAAPGSGLTAADKEAAAVANIWDMPAAEFQKLTNKVTGF